MATSDPPTLFFAAAHALIRRGRTYLAVRRCSDAQYGASQWELPGGMIESGETVEEALVREIKEETGISIKEVRLIHIYTNRDSLPDRQHFEITYQCTYRSGDVRLNPREHDSFAWLHLNEIRRLSAKRDFLSDLLLSQGADMEKECAMDDQLDTGPR